MDMMEISLDFDETEEVQRAMLPNENDAVLIEDIDDDDNGRDRYLAQLTERGMIRPELPKEERWDEMENGAMRVFEEGVNNASLPFRERRAVAEKIFEIRGVLGRNNNNDNGGNTFVFSDEAAANVAKVFSSLNRSGHERTVSD